MSKIATPCAAVGQEMRVERDDVVERWRISKAAAMLVLLSVRSLASLLIGRITSRDRGWPLYTARSRFILPKTHQTTRSYSLER